MIKTFMFTAFSLFASFALVGAVYAQTNTPMPTTTTAPTNNGTTVPSGAPSTGFGF